jgi:NAD(P)-dependent dehydrogenase (short-subunit alcohol dehydrogenase family)
MNSPDIVVVSGAGTGIGRAASHRLVADGFHVIAVGRRPGPLQLLAKELAPHLDGVSADLGTAEGAATVAERVRIADRISSAGRRCAGVVAAAGGLSPRGATVRAKAGDPRRNGDWKLNGGRALDDVPGPEDVPGRTAAG